MAAIAGEEELNRHTLRRLRDWFWPMLDGEIASISHTIPAPELSEDVAKEVLGRLQAAADSELDRLKAIDAKLMAVCAVAPICVTLLLAMVGFMTANKPEAFTRLSVLGVTVLSCYVSLQFLRALLAAIAGLERRGVRVPTAGSIWMQISTESSRDYVKRACGDLALRLGENRETVNDKVSHMALAHCAYRNAVVGMLLAVAVVSVMIAKEYVWR